MGTNPTKPAAPASTAPATAGSTTATPEAPAKVRKERRSFSTVLRDAAGNSVRVQAKRTKDGKAEVSVKHTTRGTDGKKQSKRGERTNHADLDAAKVKQVEVAKAYADLGWAQGVSRQPVAKADAFGADNRPKPVMVAPPSAAPKAEAKAETAKPATTGKK